MSSKRNTIIMILLTAGFVAVLMWSTIAAQAVECRVCVGFNGRQNCATATAASAEEAARSAQNTACGPLASGMNDAIACDRTPPVLQQCSAK